MAMLQQHAHMLGQWTTVNIKWKFNAGAEHLGKELS